MPPRPTSSSTELGRNTSVAEPTGRWISDGTSHGKLIPKENSAVKRRLVLVTRPVAAAAMAPVGVSEAAHMAMA